MIFNLSSYHKWEFVLNKIFYFPIKGPHTTYIISEVYTDKQEYKYQQSVEI